MCVGLIGNKRPIGAVNSLLKSAPSCTFSHFKFPFIHEPTLSPKPPEYCPSNSRNSSLRNANFAQHVPRVINHIARRPTFLLYVRLLLFVQSRIFAAWSPLAWRYFSIYVQRCGVQSSIKKGSFSAFLFTIKFGGFNSFNLRTAVSRSGTL